MRKPGGHFDEPAKETRDHRQEVRPTFAFLSALAAVAFALPVLAYIWVVRHYGLNVIYADNWDDIRLVAHSFSGSLTFGQLWAVHGENRILFPNLLAPAYRPHDPLQRARRRYLNAALLIATTGLLIVAHRRRSPETPWLTTHPWPYRCDPCSGAQRHLGYTSFPGISSWHRWPSFFLLLDRARLGRWAFAGAIAAAVVGSYSSLQGLLIWPSALFLLWIRSRTKGYLVVWIVATTLTVGLFFYNFHFQHGDLAYVLRHPIDSVAFYFFMIGDVVGLQAPPGGQVGNLAVVALGAVITGVAVWSVIG